jgi:adenylate cyclase
MSIEIERKFLIRSDDWKSHVVKKVMFRESLIAIHNDRKVRVRISDGTKATITVKGPRTHLKRLEYEYEIPISDAEEMLQSLCRGPQLEKVRHFVMHEGSLWHVDVYDGILNGTVIAEIELKSEDQQFNKPEWIGKEVSGDFAYRKVNMVANRMAKQASRQAVRQVDSDSR